MTPERYQQIKQVYQAAEDLPAAERDAYIQQACQGDAGLIAAVAELRAAQDAESFLSLGAEAYAPGLAHQSSSGQTIGRYKIIRELGAGGMGRVYLAARSDDFRRVAALKLLRAGVDSETLIARFRIERQILAAFDHPNIARLLDGGTTEQGLPYLLMEYIEGQPIDTYCDKRRLSIEERLRLFLPICAAVQYAHRNLVVHRDLKPSNILVRDDGTPKLLDFGIAKLLRPELQPVTIEYTAAGVRPMTPEYASPEQVLGSPITTAADQYSLGAVLYELLTGHKPYRFKTRTPHEIYEIARQAEPTRPSTAVRSTEETVAGEDGEKRQITPESVGAARRTRPDKLRRVLAGDLDNILLRALQKEPHLRYSSVEQFAEDIQRYLNGLPVLACKETFYYRASKFVRRNKGRVAAAAMLGITLIAGIATTAWQARVARAQRARAERRFQDVRKLANAVLFELHDEIQDLPGSTHARQLLVTRAQEYLDSLAHESAGDTSLQLDLASAYERVGLIQWTQYSSSLGDRAGAMASQQRAFAIRKSVLDSEPRNTSAKLELGLSCLWLGDLLMDDDRLHEALADYRQALRLFQELSTADPKDAPARKNLSSAYQRIGDILGDPKISNLGDASGAMENYRKAQELIEQMVATQPGDADSLSDLAVVYDRTGAVKAAQQDLKGALELYRKALATYEELRPRRPNNNWVQANVAAEQSNIGSILFTMKDIEGANEIYSRALAIRESVSAADPENAQAHNDLADLLEEFGGAMFKAGRLADANRYGKRLIAVRKGRAERTHATADDWNEYAWALLTCNPPQLRQPELALPAARRAVEISERHDGQILDTLALAFFNNGDRAQAIKTEREAIAVAGDRADQRRQFETALQRFESGNPASHPKDRP